MHESPAMPMCSASEQIPISDAGVAPGVESCALAETAMLPIIPNASGAMSANLTNFVRTFIESRSFRKTSVPSFGPPPNLNINLQLRFIFVKGIDVRIEKIA
jgi:hypothetical protein